MKGIFGGLFDFNHDGKMNAFESAVELAVLDDMLKEDEAETDFEMSGLDTDELEFMKPGMKLKLEKEPDNEYDKEAILVKMEGLGKIGYVANSPFTVIGESMSAGRLYDKIKDNATAKVVLVTAQGTLCKVNPKNNIDVQ